MIGRGGPEKRCSLVIPGILDVTLEVAALAELRTACSQASMVFLDVRDSRNQGCGGRSGRQELALTRAHLLTPPIRPARRSVEHPAVVGRVRLGRNVNLGH